MKIWLDTDIGSDIDDAICLSYLLLHPECELIGISTVTGNVDQRAMIASALCRSANKEVPIYTGEKYALCGDQLQMNVPQIESLTETQQLEQFDGNGVIKLHEALETYPGDLTVLAIGPLTNIAKLIEFFPLDTRKIGALMLMGGAYYQNAQEFRPLGEWNIRCDPEAARYVFESDISIIKAVGLDVTMNLRMEKGDMLNMFHCGPFRKTADIAKIWFSEHDISILHDPLAAICLFRPDVVCFKKANVTIEINGKFSANTSPSFCNASNIEIASTIDVDSVFEELYRFSKCKEV